MFRGADHHALPSSRSIVASGSRRPSPRPFFARVRSPRRRYDLGRRRYEEALRDLLRLRRLPVQERLEGGEHAHGEDRVLLQRAPVDARGVRVRAVQEARDVFARDAAGGFARRGFARGVPRVQPRRPSARAHRPGPGAPRKLQSLDPSIPRWVFTASTRPHAMRCLELLGVDDMFQGVIDVRAVDWVTKHDARAYAAAMRIAGCGDPSACLFLDDSVSNMRAAKRSGGAPFSWGDTLGTGARSSSAPRRTTLWTGYTS